MKYDLIIEDLHQSANTYDPFKICESLNVLLEYVDIENPLGDTVYLHEKPIIILANKLRHMPQSYFVCAHELGHIVNHQGVQGYYTLSKTTHDQMEVEASKFASCLCGKLYKENHGTFATNIFDLKCEFGVDESMADYFLKYSPAHVDFKSRGENIILGDLQNEEEHCYRCVSLGA